MAFLCKVNSSQLYAHVYMSCLCRSCRRCVYCSCQHLLWKSIGWQLQQWTNGKNQIIILCKGQNAFTPRIVHCNFNQQCPFVFCFPSVPLNVYVTYVQIFQGLPKKNETFFGALRGIWGVLSANFGSVRVDFTQPFSLRVSISRKLLVNCLLNFVSWFLCPGGIQNVLFLSCLSVVNFNIRYNFWTIRDRDFIFGMHTSLVMLFLMTPMTLWPWLWPLLCRLRSKAAHRDHFVLRLSVRPSVR